MFCGSTLGEEAVSRSRYSPAETIKQHERSKIRMEPYTRTQFVGGSLGSHKSCQYMGGSEIRPICGEPSVPDYSYCKKHKKECYIARK